MSREAIIRKMKAAFEHTIPSEIEHALQVLQNAEQIMAGEGIAGRTAELIAITAILHDIGMIRAKEKYGSTAGPYQEKEGPAAAIELLTDEVLREEELERICHIIGNHHTFAKIDGIDFQIIWEADLLEALKKTVGTTSRMKRNEIIERNYKTTTGRKLAVQVLLKE